MKRKDIDRALQSAGWEITHGGSHDIAKHQQKPGVAIPIPRHTEVKEYLAHAILKQAGLK